MAAHPTAPPPKPASPSSSPRGLAGNRLLNGTLVMVLLYFGREVLEPVTLAGILSLLLAPLVRGLRRVGLGHVPSVLGAVLAVTVLLLGLAATIGSQVVSMAASLPQYETTIRDKMRTVRAVTLGRLETVQGAAGRMMTQWADQSGDVAARLVARSQAIDAQPGIVPVEIHERPPTPVQVLSRVFSSVWGPLGTAGVVLVILVFVLLEYESLRDRFIRLAGGSDLRGTTHAINDAGERLSRFFVSQLAVNVCVGAVVGAGVTLLGVPHGMLWVVLTAVLRFVPYVGVFVAALSAAMLAAAVDAGWSPMFMTMGLFAVVEIVAAQAVEPHLYGHSTGLSPLSVVVAAIFWSWIWGPVGLLLSTPLTLCLVVAGRHFQALAFLDILLGDAPALTMSQRFYQRALSGDADEIIAAARAYLKRKSFARYCDKVLLPAMQLAGGDLVSGSISPEQQQKVKVAIVEVIEAIGPDTRKRSAWRRPRSVLDTPGIGLHLRHQRERSLGKWQGPLEVPPGSVTLCVGLGSLRDDLFTEILVRILRDLDIDARHLSMEDLDTAPPGSSSDSIAMVFVVSALPSEEWERAAEVGAMMRSGLPHATVAALLTSHQLTADEQKTVEGNVDLIVNSLEEAAQQAQARYPGAAKARGAGLSAAAA